MSKHRKLDDMVNNSAPGDDFQDPQPPTPEPNQGFSTQAYGSAPASSQPLEQPEEDSTPIQDIAALQQTVELREKEIKETQDKLMRLGADMQNLIKQNELEIAQAKKSAKKHLVLSLLTFLNTLHLAFSFTPTTEDEKVHKFIQTLETSFNQVIQDLKVQSIEVLVPEIGQDFDPQFMTALNPHDSEEHPKVKNIVGLGLKVDGQLMQAASVML
jgi:molecular chaperone GrpE